MSKLKWWQTAVFYQIYPRSFADGNGDGIGDFSGMTAKLDHLVNLGVDAIWLSPHFPSPNWDCGYDISDYTDVAPEYGTLDDFKYFLKEAHKRNLRVILDLVLNHTSDEHPWFIESKSSRDNPKADWYVWVDTPPNNWQSCFDGEAWTYIPERNQYYYHYFMKQQPDLNWHNPEVKEAMWQAVRFWLDLGVDGFRLDAIGTIFEDANLTPHNVPMNLAELRRFSELAETEKDKKLKDQYWHDMFKNQWGQPGVHELMKELRAILDEYEGDRMLVGEDDNIDYMGNGRDELHLVFNFPLMRTELITPAHIRKNQRERLEQLDALRAERGWSCNTLGNHDCSRLYTRFGNKLHDAELARLNAALVLTMRGTPFLYNGEEIGMTDLPMPLDTALDPIAHKYKRFPRFVLDLLDVFVNRDEARTPMQWDATKNAGFSSAAKTWLPVHPNYPSINAEQADREDHSLLRTVRTGLSIRGREQALREGELQLMKNLPVNVLGFARKFESETLYVFLNFGTLVSEFEFQADELLFNVSPRDELKKQAIRLDGLGGVIVK